MVRDDEHDGDDGDGDDEGGDGGDEGVDDGDVFFPPPCQCQAR